MQVLEIDRPQFLLSCTHALKNIKQPRSTRVSHPRTRIDEPWFLEVRLQSKNRVKLV